MSFTQAQIEVAVKAHRECNSTDQEKMKAALAAAERAASSTGSKIINGLREAVAGNSARVTIEGQSWIREPAW